MITLSGFIFTEGSFTLSDYHCVKLGLTQWMGSIATDFIHSHESCVSDYVKIEIELLQLESQTHSVRLQL